MKEKIIIFPIRTPISLVEAKVHLRLEATFTADNEYITSLIDTAVNYAENYCNRKFLTQTWEAAFDSWAEAEAYFQPTGMLQEVVQVAYYDEDNLKHVVSADDYIITGAGTAHGKFSIVDGTTLSTDLYQEEPIRIMYKCGYYQGEGWVAEVVYSVGTQVAIDYGLVAQCTVEGTSGASKPTWPNTVGDTVVDGTATWTVIGSTIPTIIRQALLILVAIYYEGRESVQTSLSMNTVMHMLAPSTLWDFNE